MAFKILYQLDVFIKLPFLRPATQLDRLFRQSTIEKTLLAPFSMNSPQIPPSVHPQYFQEP